MENYYGEEYFRWQRISGELGANLDSWKFISFISKNDIVLDFGCGGGYMLQSIICKRKYGIEVNRTAREEAVKKGIDVFRKIDDLPDIKFDIIISHHSLEHVKEPYQILRKLKSRLKKGGKLILVLPIDDWCKNRKYKSEDINQHLYTWSPQNIGCLVASAGYHVKKVELLHHAWVPFSGRLSKYLPRRLFDFICAVWSFLYFSHQIRIVAEIEYDRG